MIMNELKPYQQRFVIEHKELKDRITKLHAILESGKPHDCSRSLLESQLEVMIAYAQILEKRAEIEGIPLK